MNQRRIVQQMPLTLHQHWVLSVAALPGWYVWLYISTTCIVVLVSIALGLRGIYLSPQVLVGLLVNLCLLRPEQRQPEQIRYLTALCAADETLAKTYAQVHAFAEMVRQLHGEQLDTWLDDVHRAACPNCGRLRVVCRRTMRR